jgi:hypothetical protein
LTAFQYATHVAAGLKVLVDNAGAIAHQTAVYREIAPIKDCGNSKALREAL